MQVTSWLTPGRFQVSSPSNNNQILRPKLPPRLRRKLLPRRNNHKTRKQTKILRNKRILLQKISNWLNKRCLVPTLLKRWKSRRRRYAKSKPSSSKSKLMRRRRISSSASMWSQSWRSPRLLASTLKSWLRWSARRLRTPMLGWRRPMKSLRSYSCKSKN